MFLLRYWQSTIGKKTVMALTGLMLFGFVIAHMLGNMQIFIGPDAINDYAINLRKLGLLLWVARFGLLGAFALHVLAALQLTLRNRAARPIGYKIKENPGTTYAARTMPVSGVLVFLYIGYHLLHLTVGNIHSDYQHLTVVGVGYVPDVYHNVTVAFSNPLVVAIYGAAILVLGSHLFHGLWSAFQTLGVSHPRYNKMLKTLAVLIASAIVVGYLSVPLAVIQGAVS